jgi:phospholipid/cholesterol/gamma-HCH transport system substrate-binding protein
MTDRRDSLPRRLTVSLTTLVVLAALVWALLTKPWAPEGTRLTADFDHAQQGLSTTSPVKIRGMRVGRVGAMDLLSSGRVRLTLRIDEGVRVPASTRASLEPESVFGPKFINLVPGRGEASGPFLADRAHVPATNGSEDLDDMLTSADRTLAAIDPRDVAVIVGTLAQGLGGQGEELNGLVGDAETIVAIGHRHRERARRFTADLARLAQVPGIGDSLVGLAGDTNAVVGTAASGDDRLRRLAGGTGRMTGTLASGLDHHGGRLTEGVRSAERAAAMLFAQLGVAGPAVRQSIGALPVYPTVGWPEAPHGKQMLAATIQLPGSVCELLIGLCAGGAAGPTFPAPVTGGP